MEKLKTSQLPILSPEQVLTTYTAKEVGQFFGELQDLVYEGRSDRIEGHPAEKFQKRVEENVLYPFFVFDKNKPVACYAVQHFGEKADMGNAVVLSEYREKGLVRGKELYLTAHAWVEKNLGNKVAIMSGGSRLPVSAAIAINYCGRFPCWLPPFPSWGYPNEPLELNNAR